MKRLWVLLFLVVLSCSENSTVPDTLNEEQLDFVEEYEYITFNLSPSSFGGSFNEKWIGDVPIYLDGNITASYIATVAQELQRLNGYFTDGTELTLVNNLEDAQVHVYLGTVDEIETLWPDMYSILSRQNFSGYALFNSAGSQILNGRIWVNNPGMAIFTHELGHILGFGHASLDYCTNMEGVERSFMCSSPAGSYSPFDRAMIQMLYHPDILPGLTFEQLRPDVERLLLTREIVLSD